MEVSSGPAMKSKDQQQQQGKKNKIQRLHCCVKNYDWGRPCSDSLVAKIYAMNSGSHVDDDEPYAEFWMGTHESGPSFLVLDGSGTERVTLKSWLLENPKMLGQKVLEKWGGDLPFLFKELKAVLTVPEVVELVGAENVKSVLQITDEASEEKVKPVLRTVFTDLMSASNEKVTGTVNRLRNRLNKESQVRELTDKERLVLRLEKQYPADVGVIAAFFLNHVKLNPGEALFLGANEPHAYICGECIECMATSDNVVRAGLTPKLRDVQTLCSMLTYKQGSPEILRGVPLNPYVNRYLPPFEEFEIDCCILPQGEKVVFPAVPGPSIFLVTVGEGKINTESLEEHQITEGNVLFAAANTEISVTSASELHLYRTGVNSRFFQAP